jgi:hypothetical protein
MTATTDYLDYLYSAPTVAEREARIIPEHQFSIARTIAAHNAGRITEAAAVARIADTLAECEDMDDTTALAAAARHIASNPHL